MHTQDTFEKRSKDLLPDTILSIVCSTGASPILHYAIPPSLSVRQTRETLALDPFQLSDALPVFPKTDTIFFRNELTCFISFVGWCVDSGS